MPDLEAHVDCKSEELLARYLFVVGTGGNDYSFNYFLNPSSTSAEAFTANLTVSLSQKIKVHLFCCSVFFFFFFFVFFVFYFFIQLINFLSVRLKVKKSGPKSSFRQGNQVPVIFAEIQTCINYSLSLIGVVFCRCHKKHVLSNSDR